MNFRQSLQRIAVPACLACMVPAALPAQDQDIAAASSAQLRATYLECDRVTSTSRVHEDVMINCQRVGDVLRDRDFGGDFERMLQWWRTARGARPGADDTDLVLTGPDAASARR